MTEGRIEGLVRIVLGKYFLRHREFRRKHPDYQNENGDGPIGVNDF